jgi:hypothetical protein
MVCGWTAHKSQNIMLGSGLLMRITNNNEQFQKRKITATIST